jgi:hypothetical protein
MICYTKKKVLFILKKRTGYSWSSYECPDDKKSNGLTNSAMFINDMLIEAGYESKLVQVVDNNCIDKEVTLYKPDIVIIEAFWVVPDKFEILQKLHPKVTWVVRNHSNWPFASNEGVLVDWAFAYLKHPNVLVSCNKAETTNSFRELVKIAYPNFTEAQVDAKTPHLPNYYPVDTAEYVKHHKPSRTDVHIGNFGAIRPLKNPLVQAMAAIIFAKKKNLKLYYHINGFRIEGKAEPILKSIESLFKYFPDAELIKEDWKDHKSFLQLCADMDIVLQTSFDETFNIVLADAVSVDTMVVGSKEVPWLTNHSVVENITDVDAIVNALNHVEATNWWENIVKSNKNSLRRYVRDSKEYWLNWINGIK